MLTEHPESSDFSPEWKVKCFLSSDRREEHNMNSNIIKKISKDIYRKEGIGSDAGNLHFTAPATVLFSL